MTTAPQPLVRRTWCYAQSPSVYGVAPCSCGNSETTYWSEFEKHLWCPKCVKDFVPEHNGLFDGPVQIEICKLMCIYFDRVNLATMKLEIFDTKTNTYAPKEDA